MILGVAALQGFILALVLYFNKRGLIHLNKLIGLLLFFFSLILLEESLELLNYHLTWPRITGAGFLLDLFLGPLTLIYTLMLSRDKAAFKKKYLLHFLLPLSLNLVYIPYHFTVGWDLHLINDVSLESLLIILVILKITYQVGYQVASVILLTTFLRNRTVRDAKTRMASFVRNILIVVLILIPLVLILEGVQDRIMIDSDLITSLIMMISIYSIGYAALRNPIMYARVSDNPELQGEKYRTSPLTNSQKQDAADLLLNFMETNRPYLEPDLGFDELAEMLTMPRHHLSQIINEELNQNFYDFVNSYRVGELSAQLRNSGDKANILALGFKSGFNSKATLNRAFKKSTGISPSRFMTELRKK